MAQPKAERRALKRRVYEIGARAAFRPKERYGVPSWSCFPAGRSLGLPTMTLYRHATPKSPRLRRILAAGAALVGLLCVPAAASAADGGGTTIEPSDQAKASAIVVRKITCVRGCTSIKAAEAGATLRFYGPLLTRGKRVVYLGGTSSKDDVVAQLRIKRSGSTRVVTALIPKRAKSGPVAIETAKGLRSQASQSVVTLPEAVTPVSSMEPLAGDGPFFPIRGKWTMGTGAAAYGANRGGEVHEGQDVFAKCGTPLVAAEGGTVMARKYHERAGNYVVIRVAGADRSEAYMHMRKPALVKLNQKVKAGTQIGEVGDTGRADGCHLHFELWEGYWQGVGGDGKVIDPRPTLREWAEVGTKAQR